MALKKEIMIENGTVIVYEKNVLGSISLENLSRKILENKDVDFETKQLPVNCIRYSVNSSTETYYVLIPEDNYRFNYNGKVYIVRIPNTVLVFIFEKGRIYLKKTRMYWTEDLYVNLDSGKFFPAALHNIWDSGDICSGTDVTNPKNQADYIEKYLINLFTTEFNNDLSSGKRTMDNVAADQHRLLRKDPSLKHLLIECWWKKVIEEEDGSLSFSEPVYNIQKNMGLIKSLISH